jgi:hypothetical protein
MNNITEAFGLYIQGECIMQALHKWDGLRLEIEQYCQENRISKDDFRFLGIYEWQNVYDKVLEHFIDEQYARRNGLYWANVNGGFKHDVSGIYVFQVGVNNNLSYEWIERLPEIVKCDKVYLLLEEDSQKYWIAECSPSVVCLIINEAIGHIDYYITNKKYNWLISENHHDIVQFIGEGLDADTIKKVCTVMRGN